ncbi:MAG: FHA domain-containing protein [Synechococcus sp.]
MIRSQPIDTSAQRRRVRHVLVIEDNSGRRAVSLEAATYSLGRDPSSALVLHSNYVSRQHAILLRVPVPGQANHLYRILDGNSRGELSTNGLTINGKRQTSYDLEHGDTIAFSRDAVATYYMTDNLSDAELSNYAESAGYRSLKLEVQDPSLTSLEVK